MNQGIRCFFKVLLDDFEKKLRLPPAFVKYLDGGCVQKCSIESPTREKWTIEMENDESGLWFCGGWKEFVEDHSLEFGEFLVFEYVGNSSFKLKIFGKTGCEKPFFRTSPENHNQDKDGDIDSHLRSGKKRIVIEAEKPRKRSSLRSSNTKDCKSKDIGAENLNKSNNSSGSLKRKQPAVQEEEKPILFKSHIYSTYKTRFTVPKEVSIKQNLKSGQMLELKVPSGKSWKVKICTGKSRTRLVMGWRAFWDANRLKENDEIGFKEVESGVWLVNITRSEKQPTCEAQMCNACKARLSCAAAERFVCID